MSHETVNWDERYATKNTPWDSGEPSKELQRIVKEGWFKPSPMLELGCGTGTNAIWLAQQGFDVTALDLSPLAIKQANEKAAKAKVKIKFLVGDVLKLPEIGGPFPFVFDRGVYHHLRTVDMAGLQGVLARVAQSGGFYLTLAGNANEKRLPEQGPPVVKAEEIVAELGPLFDIVQLREYRFDKVIIEGKDVSPLAWSILLRRR